MFGLVCGMQFVFLRGFWVWSARLWPAMRFFIVGTGGPKFGIFLRAEAEQVGPKEVAASPCTIHSWSHVSRP